MRDFAFILLFFTGMSAYAADNPPATNQNQLQQILISYDGFSLLTNEVKDYREDRLIPKDNWLQMAKESNTIILDTRSKASFDQGHIDGAIHLNFSEFTDEKLAQVIPSKDTRILIYCNNNFANDEPPLLLKRVELALNIPTFINLYGYGYKNIYELSGVYDMDDPALKFGSSSD